MVNWHPGNGVHGLRQRHEAVFQQGHVELPVFFPIGQGLGHEQVEQVKTQAHLQVFAARQHAVQPLLPPDRKNVRLRSHALSVVAVRVVEAGPLSSRPVDDVRFFGGIQGYISASIDILSSGGG